MRTGPLLHGVQKQLEGTQFSFREAGDVVETTCPWGNRIRVHAPDPAKFDAMRKEERTHQIEQVGAKLRAMMPFLKPVVVPE